MYNIVELFSGIGSQAKALKNLGLEINTVGTCEWDVHAIAAYDLIHNSADIPEKIASMNKVQLLSELKHYTFSNTGKTPLDYDSLRTYSLAALQRLYTSITRNKNFVDVSSLTGDKLPEKIDILTYSFPCQDLSNVGAFHGYNKGIDKNSGSRSSLLWQVGRILSEMNVAGKELPRFLLMENVPTLLSERHFANFSTWITDLSKLGYESKYYQLNASSFGLPQNRPRLLMISVYVGNNPATKEIVLDYFKGKNEADIIDDYVKSRFYHQFSVRDLLRIDYENQALFDEAVECTPNNTVSRQTIWDENPQIVLPGNVLNQNINVVRTITTKQDRNPNSGNLYFESGIAGKSNFRYLTPRECFLFMGFTDTDYQSLKDHNIEFHKGDALFSRDKVIRMAGNSIPVKLLEGIFLQILQIDTLLRDSNKHPHLDDTREIEAITSQIRSFLFSRGIRNRVSGEYPVTADLIYPKYRTAIFIQDCFWHGHTCKSARLPDVNKQFWNNRVNRCIEEKKQHHQEAINLGWNAIVFWKCQFWGNKYEKVLSQAEIIMREKGKNPNSPGEVYFLG